MRRSEGRPGHVSWTWAVTLGVLVGCGSTEPDTDPGPAGGTGASNHVAITLHPGGDTIDAARTLSVVVIGTDGRPAAGSLVTLTIMWADTNSVGSPATTGESQIRTDFNGQLQGIQVTFGTRPGSGVVIASAEGVTDTDTVAFSVRAGGLQRWELFPDKGLFVDSVYPYHGDAFDRRGNSLGAFMASQSAGLVVDTVAKTVRATALGTTQQMTWISAGTRIVSLGVVPRGAIAYGQIPPTGVPSLAVQIANLDGYELRAVDTREFHGALVGGVFPTWSLDGSRLAYRDSTAKIYVDNLDGSRVAVATGVVGAPRLSWTADGEWLYYTRGDTETWRVRTDGSNSAFVVAGLGRVSPDGQYLALRDGGLWLYEIATGTKTWFSDAGVAAWSRDGATILAPINTGPMGERFEVYELDGTLRQVIALPSGGQNTGIVRASLSPDGAYFLAEIGTYFSGSKFWIYRFAGATWYELTHLGTRIGEPDWGPRPLRD